MLLLIQLAFNVSIKYDLNSCHKPCSRFSESESVSRNRGCLNADSEFRQKQLCTVCSLHFPTFLQLCTVMIYNHSIQSHPEEFQFPLESGSSSCCLREGVLPLCSRLCDLNLQPDFCKTASCESLTVFHFHTC